MEEQNITTTDENIYSPDQAKAIEDINSGKNVFVTGKAGGGKSFVATKIKDSKTVVIAPTGIAALNVGGMTINKAFDIPVGVRQPKDYYTVNSKMKKLYGNPDIVSKIIIDELGMVRPDVLDIIDSKLKICRKNDLPFGGIQVVGFGDLFQLEPIVGPEDKKQFYENYKTKWCVSAKSWKFETNLLTTAHRQTNDEDLEILNSIRTKSSDCNKMLAKLIDKTKKNDVDPDTTVALCNYKADAEAINAMNFSKLTGKSRRYTAQVTGQEKSWKEIPVLPDIDLKEGARVLIKANHPKGRYVNGQFATVTRCMVVGVEVILDKDESQTPIMIEPFTWGKTEYDEVDGVLVEKQTGSFTQIPLLLGYACTVHSVQGVTLESAIIDLGKGCFGHGQFYVALSRVKDFNNVCFVRNPTMRDIIVDEFVKEWYKGLE